MQTLTVPTKSYVRQYFMHENILGPDLIVTKRHMLGELISLVLSFGPVAADMLPVDYRPGGGHDGEELLSMDLQVTFYLDKTLISPHHLFAIGKAMQSMFEFGLFNFALGYFRRHQALPWKAAVVEFFTKYGIDTSNREEDYIRRYMHLKYNDTIKHQYQQEVAEHNSALMVKAF